MNLGLVVFVVIVAAVALGAIVFRRHHLGRVEGPDPGPIIIAFGSAFPEEAVRDVLLTQDGEAAFLRLADGKIGFVQAQGRRSAMRVIAAGAAVVNGPVGDRGLSVTFNGRGEKARTFVFATPKDAAEISLWLCDGFAAAETSRETGEDSAAR